MKRNRDSQKFVKRLGQKCLTPRNKKKLTKIAFQIFVNFGLFPKEFLIQIHMPQLVLVIVLFVVHFQ
ncbi:hypothetical protein [Enterococcus durans]|uniref:hypothetical protein n=1 Tax=Enterococcus durans TaxID=53345 RepID=UPI0030CA3421